MNRRHIIDLCGAKIVGLCGVICDSLKNIGTVYTDYGDKLNDKHVYYVKHLCILGNCSCYRRRITYYGVKSNPI